MTSKEPSKTVNAGLRWNPNTNPDAHKMWQGMQNSTDYKGKLSCELPNDESLPDDLNVIYARFEASNTEPCMTAPAVPGCCLIS